MKLYLSRHAESQGNLEVRLQGRKEYPLTEKGKSQAAALADRFVAAGVTAIYSSPLLRTMQTAEAVGAACGLPVVQEPRLQEYDFGDQISGLTWEAIRHKHPDIIKALADNSDFPRYPGEEGRAVFRDRVFEALDEIVARHFAASESVAIITHAGPIVVYVLESLGRKYSRPIPFAIDNASVTVVEVAEPQAFAPVVVTAINDRCHLSAS